MRKYHSQHVIVFLVLSRNYKSFLRKAVVGRHFVLGPGGAGCGAVICGKRNVCNAPGVQLQEDARTMEEPNARESILWDGVHRRLNIVGIINIVGWKSAVRDNNK